MMYLSGTVRPELLGRHDVGLMLTPNMGNRPNLTSTPWASDTGCFSNPASYSTRAYLDWLDSHEPDHATCLFATAPDVWGDGAATIALSLPTLAAIRKRVPVALILQPGSNARMIPWNDIDAVFMGGPNSWQTSEPAYALIQEGKQRGKWAHRGRVNSQQRLLGSLFAGYNSVDGTYLAFGPDINLPKLEGWLRLATAQAPLW